MAVHALKSVKDTSLYSDVYQHLGVGVAVYDVVDEGADFRFVSMNAEALRISGVEPEHIEGKLLTDAFPGAVKMGMVDALRRVHSSGANESLPPLHYQDQSTDAWYRNDIFQLDSGRLMAMYVDITEDVLAQRELKESETRYELLTESLADGIYDWNLEDDTVYFSPSWKAQLGYQDHELPNDLSSWQTALHPDQRDSVNEALQQFLESDSHIWDVEFQLRHKDGRFVWIHTRATPVRDPESGTAQRLLGVHMDVDEKKRARDESEQHLATINAIFDAMPDLFFLLDSDGCIEDFRASAGSDLYRKPEDFLGRPMQEVLPANVGVDFLSAMQEARLTRELVTHEYALPMIGGSQHYESRISYTDAERYAVIVRNVTNRYEAEKNLADRVRETEGMYQLYQGIQRADSVPELLRLVLPPLLRSTPRAGEVSAFVSIDEHRSTLGEPDPGGSKTLALIYDGDGARGELGFVIPGSAPRLPEEQRFVNAASTAIGLWLRTDKARRGLRTYERIVANTQDQLALLDTDLRYRVSNRAYANRIGCEPSQIEGRDAEDVLELERYRDNLEPKLRQALKGSVVNFQEWRDTPDGPRYMNLLYSPYTEEGQIQGVIVSGHDITELHDAQAQIRRAARVFSSSGEAILMTELDGTITDVNDSFCQICGFEPDEVIGKTPSILNSGHHNKTFFAEMFSRIDETGRWHGEIWNRRSSGETFPCLMTISRVEDESSKIQGYVGVFSDITTIKENEQRLEMLANHDPLTGLPNRSQLSRHLDSRVQRSMKGIEPFTVMFIDLDKFKHVNDTLGHNYGDVLLQEVTKRLLGVLRVNDMLARVGGDEFVAVLPGIASATNASLIAEKIITALMEQFCVNGEQIHIGASIGVCCHPSDGDDAETLIRNADTAMYEAKAAGRSTWRCYDREMTVRASRHWSIMNALGKALSGGDYQLAYQPIFDLESNRIVGLEALSRWNHRELGRLDPEEFIAAAEQAGHIWDIDVWVLENVCEQVSAWLKDGLEPGKVAVNISGRTLSDPNFVGHLKAILERHGVRGCDLCLELTESALNLESEDRADLGQALVDLGIGLSADDFGSGSSSLGTLSRLPITTLKIDGCFIRDAGTEPLSATVAKTIAAMGLSLNLEIIAEGIETDEQAAFAAGLGPLRVQGNHYAPPMEAAACAAILRAASPRS